MIHLLVVFVFPAGSSWILPYFRYAHLFSFPFLSSNSLLPNSPI